MTTIDDLLRGGGGVKVQEVLRNNQKLRGVLRSNNGYTKKREWQLAAQIDIHTMFINPETKKYFSWDMDEHEKKKNLELFLKKYPQYLVTDRYGSGISI